MKRILFIPGIVEETIGGAELQARYIAQALEKSGYDIYGIQIHPNQFATPKYNSLFLCRNRLAQKISANSLYFKQIYNLVKKIKPDVVYSRGFIPHSLAPAVFYSCKNHCKSVWHISHNRFVSKFKIRTLRTLPFQLIDQRLLKYGIKNVDHIICQTEQQKILLQQNFNRQGDQVIPNFHPIPSGAIQKEKTIQVVWVANFKKSKQPELFIRLASELRVYEDVRFIMIGHPANNSWMDTLLQQIERLPNICFLGGLDIDDVNNTLARSHIFISTSQEEGFPNSFIQAWMRKVPVISLNVDIDGLLEKGTIGFLCRSYEKMVHYTKALIKDGNKIREMGEAAQAHAFEHYSDNMNLKKILPAFRD